MSCRQGQWLYKISLLSEGKARCHTASTNIYLSLLVVPGCSPLELKGYGLVRPSKRSKPFLLLPSFPKPDT